MKNTRRLRYLIQRYTKNTCSRQEMEEFFDYVQNSHYDEDLGKMLREVWESEPSVVNDPRLLIPDPEKNAAVPLSGKWNVLWRVAASILVFVAIGIALYAPDPKQNESADDEIAAAVTSRSTQDERRMIALPDGSSVWLNRDSKLDYPVTFSGNKREVTLTGEAFFDIRRDGRRPFIIYSGQVKTTVLGTAFNIRAFPDERSVTVTVARGKVLVQDDDKHESILLANQQISIIPAENKLVQQNAKADSVADWIHQDLILDNITFDEAATIIEEKYAVEVNFQNENLKGCTFTSTFLQEASLEQMLTAICIVNRATFRIENQKVFIDGEGCERKINDKP